VSNLELMQAHRKYIKEGELNEYYLENSKEKVEQRFFFLFNDMFMCRYRTFVTSGRWRSSCRHSLVRSNAATRSMCDKSS